MDELNNFLLTNSNSNGNSSSTGRLTGLAMNGFPVARLEDVINWYINTQSHVFINSNASSLWPQVMFCLLVINSCQIATEAQLNQDHYTLTKPLHDEFKQRLQAFLSNTSPTQLIKQTLSGCLEQTASSSGSLRQLLKLHKEKLRSCHDPYLQQSLESAERERAADWRNLRYRSIADITFEEPKFDDKTLAKLFSLYFEERRSALIAVTYVAYRTTAPASPRALIALAWSFIRFGLCFKIGSSTLKTQLCSPNIKTDLVVACLAQSYFSWFLASVTAITLNPLISISVMETLQKLHRNMEHEAFVGSLLAYACLARNILALKINLFPSAQPPLLERLLMAQLNRKPSSFTGVKDLSRQSMLPLVTQ
ncbi:hypothetical protein PSTT_14898 [Puccinia striiformis]|uniref:Uncharacterized protein n=1 Tax=Puccinia striiformis TaxID=27350 RepID=A0A2S4UK52_9BASI|nr:hypothetical protein PSTT_14898 [Puccinia striiformis]